MTTLIALGSVQTVLTVLSIIAALVAAGLWFGSARVKIPIPTFDGMGPDGDFLKALNRSAHLNKWAAGVTGGSVLLQLLATVKW